MRVKVLYFGALGEELKCSGEDCEIESGSTTEDLFKNLANKNHDFISWQNRLLVAVNCEHVREKDRVLIENDEVALMPPLSGG